MRNLLEKILTFINTLKHNKNKKSSYSYSIGGNKTYMTGKETVTLTAQNEIIKTQVRDEINNLYKIHKNNVQMYLDYIESNGTKIYKLKFADKILNMIGEEEGIIFEQNGIKALLLALLTEQGILFNTKPMFVLREGTIEPLSMLHNFYRWYSWKKKLPGFSSKSQKLLKIYMKYPEMDMTRLKMNEVIELQEAVARDREATDFCLHIARETEGGKNVQRKLNEEGGANI